MSPESILLQVVFLPIVLSIVPLLLERRVEPSKIGWFPTLLLLYCLTIEAPLALALLSGREGGFLYHVTWSPNLSLTFGLLADGVGLFMSLTILLISFIVALYSVKYMEHEHNLGMYHALYLIYVGGMVGCVLASDMLEFYVFFELMLIPSWALIHGWGTGEREKIAFKYLIYTHVGALSLLIGILATASVYGTFDLLAIRALASSSSFDGVGFRLIVIAMLIGLMVKLAIFPFHTWLPDAHAEAPTPVSALLSPLMIGIGGYGIFRIIFTSFQPILREFSFWLSVLALVTMVYGGLMALAQDDLKRLFAYSSISQMGYILFGLSSMMPLSVIGSFFHYFSHGAAKAVLFMISGIFIHQFGTRSISKLRGLAPRMPVTSIAMLTAFLSLSGIPPLCGFQSEWMIFLGAMMQGVQTGLWEVFVVIAAIAASTVTLSYALWTVKRVLFGSTPSSLSNSSDAPAVMLIPLVALVALSAALGAYPQPVNTALERVVEASVI